jgi:hypothetical protein
MQQMPLIPFPNTKASVRVASAVLRLLVEAYDAVSVEGLRRSGPRHSAPDGRTPTACLCLQMSNTQDMKSGRHGIYTQHQKPQRELKLPSLVNPIPCLLMLIQPYSGVWKRQSIYTTRRTPKSRSFSTITKSIPTVRHTCNSCQQSP